MIHKDEDQGIVQYKTIHKEHACYVFKCKLPSVSKLKPILNGYLEIKIKNIIDVERDLCIFLRL